MFTNAEAYQQFTNSQNASKTKSLSPSLHITNENWDAEQRIESAKQGKKFDLGLDNNIAEKMKKGMARRAVKTEEKEEDL